MKLKYKKLYEDSIVPTKGSILASGFDLYAHTDYIIESGQTVLIKTGIAFELDSGTEMQVRPRSGLSLKTGLRVANAPGTIDADFIGQCCVILTNTGTLSYTIKRGERIAQAVLCPVFLPELEEVVELKETDRGINAFGSTGK